MNDAIDNAIGGTANNVNGVGDLSGWEPNDPPSADDLRTLRDKLNELIGGLHR